MGNATSYNISVNVIIIDYSLVKLITTRRKPKEKKRIIVLLVTTLNIDDVGTWDQVER